MTTHPCPDRFAPAAGTDHPQSAGSARFGWDLALSLRALSLRALSLLALSLLAIPGCDRGGDGDAKPKNGDSASSDGSLDPGAVGVALAASPILDALRDLEGRRDAKCHSTACRFENFLYGTPLTEEAREERAELQKQLLRSLWSHAAEAAGARGATEVALVDLQPVLDGFITHEDVTGPEGAEVQVTFAGVPAEHRIAPLRLRQYGSISYSLRAILGAQQDQLFTPGDRLLPLASESVSALSAVLDLVMLSVLSVADQQARTDSASELTPERIVAAWESVVPAARTPGSRNGGAAARTSSASDAASVNKASLEILDRLIDGKLEAYSKYNAVLASEATAVYRQNIQAYYARFPFPVEQADIDAFESTYDDAILGIVRDLLSASVTLALADDRHLIRTADIHAAVQQFLPHTVDDFEDVTFFPRLGPGERVKLESYDCDSYRDIGRHWILLRRAISHMDGIEAVPDPFAVEILTEAISDVGVLIHRMAGVEARESKNGMFLLPSHVDAAMAAIRDRARRHHEAKDAVVSGAIVSSNGASSLGARDGDRYFVDVTAASGVTYEHRSSKWLSEFRRDQKYDLPTFSGGGVAAEDLDGDGVGDLLFVGGSGNVLYRGRGDGAFEDVTAASGLDWVREDGAPGEARQPILADFDNDGRADVLITYANDVHRIYQNLGEMRFEDQTEAAQLGGKGSVGGAACVFDYDNDGLLDIYVTYFGNYLQGEVITQERNNQNAQPNRLHRNRDGFKFALKPLNNGAGDTGWAQAVSHADFDGDGLQDLIVANDFGKNAWLRNKGNGRFENVAESLGLTKSYHSMNVGVAELNGDAYPDVYISNIATMVKDNKYVLPDMNTPLVFDPKAMAGMLVKESNVLYVSQAKDGSLASYAESDAVERGESTTGWAWGAHFFDFDHDGDEDLYCVNGSNEYNIFFSMVGEENPDQTITHYYFNHDGQSNVFFVNEGGRFANRSSRSGTDFVGNSRAVTYVDFEGDGDLDIVVSNFHGPATLLRNDTLLHDDAREGSPAGTGSGGGSGDGTHHWFSVRLVGDPSREVSRDAIGARVVAKTASLRPMVREIRGGSGYLSMLPKELHFGCGLEERVDLTITWPNGDVQEVTGLEVDRRHVIEMK